jgi:outer membrane protein, heavy metal efflux system
MTALQRLPTVAWNPGESPGPEARPGTRWIWTRIALAALVVLGSWTALAQDSALAAPLSLSEARKLAFLRNWDLLAARSDVDLAVAQGIVARQFPNPVLSLAESKISVDRAHGSSTPSGNGYFNRSYDTVAAVSQLIEIGGKRTARRDSARAGEAAARERFSDARRLLELGVTRAYVDALQTDESARILANSAAALFQEASLARLRVRAGDISTNDGTQIEIAAERLQLDAARAASDSTNARIRLATLLGEKTPVASLAFADSLESLGRSVAPSPGLDAAAVAARPDVRAAEAGVRQAEAGIRLEKAQRVPDPTVAVLYDHEPPDQPNTVGLGVSFPLPLWNRNRGSIEAAKVLKTQAETEASRARASAAAEAAIARRDFEAASVRRGTYRDTILPKSSAVRETVTFAYRNGGASLLDLLSAQRGDNEVRLAATQADADVIVARAALAAALNEHAADPSRP